MITVKELMTRELYTLKPTDTVYQARELMLNKQVRHIPIVDKRGNFLGLVTKRDLLAASVSMLADIDVVERNELEEGIPINEIMITDVIVAQESTLLLEAAQFMLKQKHGCLPVFQDNKLTGILTEADFVKLAIHLMEEMAEDNKK